MKFATGVCPHCKQEITPTSQDIAEENKVRRNIIFCPNCKTKILKCMGVGCNNYALGGVYWDDSLCPDCFEKVKEVAAQSIEGATKLIEFAGAALSLVIAIKKLK